jgi:hypothetical protein
MCDAMREGKSEPPSDPEKKRETTKQERRKETKEKRALAEGTGMRRDAKGKDLGSVNSGERSRTDGKVDRVGGDVLTSFSIIIVSDVWLIHSVSQMRVSRVSTRAEGSEVVGRGGTRRIRGQHDELGEQ